MPKDKIYKRILKNFLTSIILNLFVKKTIGITIETKFMCISLKPIFSIRINTPQYRRK